MEAAADRKYGNVLRTIRGRIVDGIYSRAHRLPTWSELGEEFGVGVGTIQKAINRLVDDGFVTLRARKGTYVADTPPHLCNYGLVFPALGEWSRYYTAVREAVKVSVEPDLSFEEYHISRDIGSRSDMARLCKDVYNHRLAGLILIGSEPDINALAGTPILDEPGVARVLFSYYPQFNIPMIIPDDASFLDRAIEYLFSQKRRRVAHLCMDFSWVHLEKFEADLTARGLDARPYWIQPIPAGPIFRGTSHLVNMMMQLEGDKRPDALIIHDDNLVEHAVAGLLAAGIKVPDEVEVVAKCNHPSSVSNAIPIKHLGPDFRLFLKEALRVMEMQHNNEEPAMTTKFSAVFRSELVTEV